jgi:hypothetical protein
MKTKKELLGTNVDLLPLNELQELPSIGLSWCQNCGGIDEDDNLIFIDDCKEDENIRQLKKDGCTVVCKNCLKKG